MKIVFDCFKLVKGAGKSIGIYNLAKNLVSNLAEGQRSADREDIRSARLVVIGNRYNKDDFDVQGVDFVEEKKMDPLKKVDCLLWELAIVSKRVKDLRADKVIFPRGFAALTHPVADIIIIHDLIPFYYARSYPGYFKKIENAYIMSRLKRSAVSCSKIITISEASKKDILQYMGVNADKVTVIHNGCNGVGDIQKEKGTDGYIIAVTSMLPHKNAEGIIRSYESYHKCAEDPLDLVVIGIDGVEPFGLPNDIKNKIRCYKYIKDNREMYQLIANATVFLFLSLIEGFGFPPIEAMQLGVPVICSDQSSLPEVVGEAAILVDPNDHEEIGIRLAGLIKDEVLQKELISRGIENVKRFSWESRVGMYWEEILG